MKLNFCEIFNKLNIMLCDSIGIGYYKLKSVNIIFGLFVLVFIIPFLLLVSIFKPLFNGKPLFKRTDIMLSYESLPKLRRGGDIDYEFVIEGALILFSGVVIIFVIYNLAFLKYTVFAFVLYFLVVWFIGITGLAVLLEGFKFSLIAELMFGILVVLPISYIYNKTTSKCDLVDVSEEKKE